MRTVSETHSPAQFMLLYNITEMMLPYSKAASTTAKQE